MAKKPQERPERPTPHAARGETHAKSRAALARENAVLAERIATLSVAVTRFARRPLPFAGASPGQGRISPSAWALKRSTT